MGEFNAFEVTRHRDRQRTMDILVPLRETVEGITWLVPLSRLK